MSQKKQVTLWLVVALVTAGGIAFLTKAEHPATPMVDNTVQVN